MKAHPNTLRTKQCKDGFTLIEILAAMVVLVLIVLMMGRVFNDSVRSWTTGNTTMAVNNNARAVVDFMARQIEAAIIDDYAAGGLATNCTVKLVSDAYTTFDGRRTDELYIVSATESPRDEKRAVRQLGFYVSLMTDATNRFAIRMSETSTRDAAAFQCYERSDWWDFQDEIGGQVIAENVVTLELWLYHQNGATVAAQADYDSSDPTLGIPYLMDIYIEMLGDADAQRAEQLQGEGTPPERERAKKFIDRVAVGYATRLHFPNRQGYTGVRH